LPSAGLVDVLANAVGIDQPGGHPRRSCNGGEGSCWEKSITVVGSVPQSPESITASTA
jgi:hypothetical protein